MGGRAIDRGVESRVSSVRPMRSPQDLSDEELMQQLAAGRQEALGTLYSRYASVVLNLAAHALGRCAAEEVAQDVFLSVWRNAAVFAPDRGAFRPWVMQITHNLILNELRRRRSRPQVQPDPDGLLLASLPDGGPEPEEAVWRQSLRSTVQSAVKELPPPQRQALDLAFFKHLTHEETAVRLGIPLGTAKTRIRTGLQKLLEKFVPAATGFALVGVFAILGIVSQSDPAWPAATPLDRAASVAFPLYVNMDDGTKRACTGFYVRPLAVNGATGETIAGWVLTAGHCVVHGVVIRATDVASYEEGHPAVGSWTTGYDFGLLELSEYGPSRSIHTYLPLLDRPLVAGEPVFVLGFGQGQLRNVVGTYVGLDELGLRIKTLEAVRGGMSGSPVLTSDGEVAGILVATRCKGPYVPALGSCDDDAYDVIATPLLHVLEALRVLEPRFFEPPMVLWPKQY